ncbi:MAG: BACON domain-containing protein [Bacteroidetes bacterium]|uniref:BACON domain-containing protein n=1 Tax=Candidatus Merdivivens pullistercoris TaxID=2840873 RepID=A0A9D9NAD1_9BACT|nr:BACON domain-containing protein [Candidatus Merdivivens pullistercoris]
MKDFINDCLLKSLTAVAVLAGMFSLSSCEDKPVPPLPEIVLGDEAMQFGHEGGSDTFVLYVNRDWEAVPEADWIAIDPPSGKGEAGKVTVTVLENPAGDARSSQVVFKTLAVYATLDIAQDANPDGIPSLFFGNDFDKELARENESGYWPYLDQSDCWKNETGFGSGEVEYYFDGMSARANSTSNGSYSDYEGSGNNNLFFGSGSPYFVIGNIKVHPEQREYTLSFGTEKYLYGNSDNTFVPEEFPVMVSPDGETWVEVGYTFASGQYLNGRWDLATSEFVLPEGTETLWIRFAPTLGSAHRLDDVTLKAGGNGDAVDWSDGVTITIPGRQ